MCCVCDLCVCLSLSCFFCAPIFLWCASSLLFAGVRVFVYPFFLLTTDNATTAQPLVLVLQTFHPHNEAIEPPPILSAQLNERDVLGVLGACGKEKRVCWVSDQIGLDCLDEKTKRG